MAEEEESPEIQIPEDEQAVIEMIGGEEASEQQKNLAIAQAKLIGDI
jgi:hypothetical protein